jgi:hypothetical protein
VFHSLDVRFLGRFVVRAFYDWNVMSLNALLSGLFVFGRFVGVPCLRLYVKTKVGHL